jgi:hypothetical protein
VSPFLVFGKSSRFSYLVADTRGRRQRVDLTHWTLDPGSRPNGRSGADVGQQAAETAHRRHRNDLLEADIRGIKSRYLRAGGVSGTGDFGQMDVISNSTWKSVVSLLDVRVAHTIAALLEAEAIAAQVMSSSKLIGEALLWEVHVPAEQLEAACCLLAQSQLTESELSYLATGVLDGTDDSE